MTSSFSLRPIGVQLYSVRDLLTGDYDATIEHLAGMNLLGVELAGLFKDESAAATAQLCRDAGLEIIAAHAPLPLGDQQSRTLETLAELGTTRLVCAYIPPDEFSSADAVRGICDRLNEADAIARAHGLTLYYHNHWWEYQPLPGTGDLPYHLMHTHLAHTVHYEIDAYWVRAAGLAPTEILADLGDRVTLLHVKDGAGTTDPAQSMLAVGEGVMNYHAIIPAAAAAHWLVIELDRCATDMLAAINASADYLDAAGLGRLHP